MSDPQGLIDLEFRELADGLASGRIKSEELVREAIERIHQTEHLRAWSYVDELGAIEIARQLDHEREQGRYRGPLHGIPVGFKASIAVAGMPFDAGVDAFAGQVARTDSDVVATLRNAGVVPLGVQVLHGGSIGDVVRHGHRATSRNPWNDRYVPSGSSCGSAVATSVRSCVFSVGGDTGGSVRGPASSCGVVGFKPSWGFLSTQGTTPLAWSLDTLGIFAREVDVVVEVSKVFGMQSSTFSETIRVAPLAEESLLGITSEVKEVVSDAAQRAGNHPRLRMSSTIPLDLGEASEIWRSRLAELPAFYRREMVTAKEQLPPRLVHLIESRATVTREEYAESWERGARLGETIDDALKDCDILILPASPSRTLKWTDWGGSGDSGSKVHTWYRFLIPFNVTGHPAVTIPWNSYEDSVPAAIQLVARHGAEDLLLEAARVFTEISPWADAIPTGVLSA